MEFVKIGIVGVGNIGRAHLKSISKGKINNLKVTALCDVARERISEFTDLKLFDKAENLIKSREVDAILVSTPHNFHSDIAKLALENNIHVLCEKPIDITVTKAKELNEIALKSQAKFAVMFNQRTDFLFKKAKELIENGEIGKIKRSIWIISNWFRTQSYYNSGDWRATWAYEGGGVLLNQAPHNLDLWQWLCGMPSEVTAFCNEGKFHNIEVEDEVTLFAKYPNGATGTFITSTGDFPGTNRLEITGDLGKIVLEEGKLKLYKNSVSTKFMIENALDSFAKCEVDYFEFVKESETNDLYAHEQILQNFTNAILFDEKLIAKGIEGVNELSISNAAYLSQWTGNKAVEIPFDNKIFDEFLNNKAEKSLAKEKTKISTNDYYSNRWNVNW